jgi:hypothetical protein
MSLAKLGIGQGLLCNMCRMTVWHDMTALCLPQAFCLQLGNLSLGIHLLRSLILVLNSSTSTELLLEIVVLFPTIPALLAALIAFSAARALSLAPTQQPILYWLIFLEQPKPSF